MIIQSFIWSLVAWFLMWLYSKIAVKTNSYTISGFSWILVAAFLGCVIWFLCSLGTWAWFIMWHGGTL